MSSIIKCDRCGQEIKPGELGYISMMQRAENGDLTGENPFEKLDFCPRCMDLIAKFVTGDVPKREKAVKPAKQAKRKELDVPKMRALAEGGWSMEKIADEMGCSAQTVRNRLNERK